MRFYEGDRSEGHPQVSIVHREPLSHVSEIVEVLAELERLPKWHENLGEAEIEQRAAFRARKDDLVARIKAAEQGDRRVRLVFRGVHSHEGFEWGFSGNGPADLAFSILTNELGEEPPPTVYLKFRDDVVAKLPRESFELGSSTVAEWVEANRELVENELFFKIPPPAAAMEEEPPSLALVSSPVELPEAQEAAPSAAAISVAGEVTGSGGTALAARDSAASDVAMLDGGGAAASTVTTAGSNGAGGDPEVGVVAEDLHRGVGGDADAGPTASALVRACEEAWAAIQAVHPEVPDAVMLLGTGVQGGRLVKLGHWWGGRWLADGQVRGEVLIAGEALHLKPAEVFEVLLHEAAHGLNAARGIKDASRGGRYHNDNFRVAAEEVGLEVKALPPYGMASTSLPEAGQERYAASIKRLEEEMRIARQLERGRGRGQEAESGGLGDDGADRSKGSQAAGCGCGRKLRMAPSVLAKGPVLCGVCETDFVPGRNATRSAEAPASTGQSEITELLTGLAEPDPEVLFEWYRNFDTATEEPMRAASPAEAQRLVDEARAVLKAEGILSGPELAIGGRHFAKGDRVIVPHGDTEADIPAGTLGTVEDVDVDGGVMEVDFATAARLRIGTGDGITRALRHDYAEVRPPVASGGNGGERLSAEVRHVAQEVEL